jgi:hypothetical protein
VNGVSEGFKLIRSGGVINFYCSSCDCAAEP